MNLNQLYYLQAIAQARGLTRAADALYVTQSNLSHSMAALVQPHPGPGTAGLHQRCQRHSDPLVRQSLLPEPGQPGYYFYL